MYSSKEVIANICGGGQFGKEISITKTIIFFIHKLVIVLICVKITFSLN